MSSATSPPVPSERVSRVLVIGGTGYIGSGVVRALKASGREVTRGSRRAVADDSAGVRVDVRDVDSVVGAVAEVAPDVVVYAAGFDFEAESAALPAVLDRGVPLVYTSGIWWMGEVGSEPFEEGPPIGDTPRARIERLVLETSAVTRTRAVVVRPAVVYGQGGGIPAEMVDWAREYGVGRYVGRPGVRWPLVHVDDLAELYARAIVAAPSGSVLHGVADGGVLVSEIAAAADRAAGGGGRSEAWAVEDAAPVLGSAYAASLALDQAFASVNTRILCDWNPTRASLVTELLTGQYTDA